jgi:hypothetical protein
MPHEDGMVKIINTKTFDNEPEISQEWIEEFLGEKVNPPYMVEYRSRGTGKYLVDDDRYSPTIAVWHEGLKLDGDGMFPIEIPTLDVCFLPDRFRGKRVDRTIIKTEE